MASAEDVPTSFLVDPASLHILLVDANGASRANITALLQKYHYQVTSCKTSQEAIQTLEARRGPGGTSGFDLILKEHSPAQGTNACRLLRKAQTEGALKGIPIIVVSTTEDRDVMVSCLQLGAADYMIKPLRNNEVRNLWARVYWWRRASYLQQQPAGSVQPGDFGPALPSNSSQETKGEEEGQERLEDSGEGSAPNGSGSLRHGSNDNASKEGGSKNDSKNDSKGANGWSGTQPKPAGDATNGQGNGGSATNQACQGSNHPSSDVAAAVANGGSPPRSVAPPAPTLHIAPLDLSTRPSGSKQPTHSALGALEFNRDSGDTAPGFRAYVSGSNPRKRSADILDAEMMGRSSGSDHTQSLGDPNSSKRRNSASRMDSGSAGVVTSDVTFNLPADCAPTSAPPTGGSGVGLTRMGESANPNPAQGQPGMSQQAANGFGGYYPFGMMTPFTVPPQFWSQMGGQGSNPEMAAMFSQFSQQAQAQQGMSGMTQGQQQQQQQQQQVAMHNQLMMQHSMLMQQCGMPAPPFVSFQNLNRAMATNQASQANQANQPQVPARHSTAPSRRGSAPTPESGHLPVLQSAGREGQGYELGRRATTQAWGSGMPRQHSLPASGMFTGTGNGTSNGGNTLGSAPGNATGATSHASAQLGLDGSLTEPSRQERRAQALHKYKQKRKNLNFTKKIRYESRKQLAQARPRVKGQFVRLQPGEEESSDPIAMEVDEEISGTEEPQTTPEADRGDAQLPGNAIESAQPTHVRAAEECMTSPLQTKQEATVDRAKPVLPTTTSSPLPAGVSNAAPAVPKMSQSLMTASQQIIAGQ